MRFLRRVPSIRVGLRLSVGAMWIGWHYARYHRRLCINLVPCVTVWIVWPGGTLPYGVPS